MKKISLLKKVGLIATPIVAMAPIALTVSCANNGVATSFISWSSLTTNNNLNGMEYGHYKYDDMLLGSKKFFDGNYILFVGSNMYDNTCKFFSGQTSNRSTSNWANDGFDTSILRNDAFLSLANANENGKHFLDFGFVSFVDDFNNEVRDEANHKIIVTKDSEKGFWATWPIKPFDKWTEELISSTRKFMRETFDYEWNTDEDNPEVVAGDYIRTDDQAKTFREFAQRGALFFPTNDDRKIGFDVADDNSSSLMVIYKDGKLQEIASLPINPCTEGSKDSETTDTLTGTINKYFIEKDEEESEDEDK